MVTILIVIACISFFIIGYAMVGYPIVLKLLDKLLKPKANEKNSGYEPMVSYMIVAHNEEKVIREKLENALTLDYPVNKLQIIIASDNSTDKTNQIVEEFIEDNRDRNIIIHCTREHKGKTNAQNEAQKLTTGEILVMTDANSILRANAIRELVSYYTSPDIVYVCGKLEYSNASSNATGRSESTYWNLDLSMRDIESRIKTITAGNGAIYSCRNFEYVDIPPIECHDSSMPYIYSKAGKRALFNPEAVATEKAGENDKDEYKRKVRMNRGLLSSIGMGFSVINIFKYGWFAFFYFGHRTCRYLLWLMHLLLFITTGMLAYVSYGFWFVVFVLQVIFYIVAFVVIKTKLKNPLLRFVGYYGMTIFAQFNGIWNIVTGKAKPTWEKAESTR